MVKEFVRLPTTVVPSHYDLRLTIDLKELKFSGDVDIQLKVKTSTAEVSLHSVGLEISNVWITFDSKKVSPSSTKLDVPNQTLVLTFPESLPVGDASLHLAFAAPLDNQMRGLYKSKYKGPEGDNRYLAVTQFEANAARRCFPCWDEPAIKATFSITLNVPADRTALSNMPEESSKEDPTDKTRRDVTFQKTPIMSTYLVALVVGEYDYLERDLESGVKVRVFTPVGRKEQGEFALDVAARALPYYTEYFQIPYPLPKLDLITVPDFSAGAMENWGLVTYREVLLLVDPVNSSALYKQNVVLTVAHELAHQWFGNIVTMEWWTHLWLNEGYASFSQTLCTDYLFPEYEIWTQFMSHSFIPALSLDSLKSTHPIEVPVGPPEEVDEIFDEISYDKGASVIRMLHSYLGDAHFRKGMTLYLNRHKYSNTFTEDLWRALGESSNKPVEKVMSSWTKIPGFPVVSVDSKETETGIELTLSQTRFLLNGEKDESGILWVIPIEIICSMDKEVRTVLLETATSTITLPPVAQSDWIKINSGACGFFRTKYDSNMLRRLIPAVQAKKLPPVDRINILDDLMAMVHSGYSATVELLEMIQAYKQEDDYSVYVSMTNCLSTLCSVMTHRAELKDKLAPLVCEVFSYIYQKLGWEPKEGENYLDTLLRPLVLIMLGKNKDQSVIDKCHASLASHADGSNLIPADLRSCVFKICMVSGDQKTLDTMMKLFEEADRQESRDRISRSMGNTSNPALIKQVIDFAMTKVRLQDMPFVLYSVALSSSEGSHLVWDYFKKNHATFVEKYANSDLMIRLIKFVSRNFASKEDAADVRSFFEGLPSHYGEMGIAQNIENILVDAAWMERDAKAIEQYLANWSK